MCRPVFSIVLAGFFFLFPGSLQAGIVFFDGFESRDLSTTNSDGFKWLDLNRTSLVVQDTDTGNTVVFPRLLAVNDGRDWTAKEGDVCMRFRYSAGQPMAEQRFVLGTHYTDIWIGYWIRVPVNYTQGALNNKFLALWVGADGYDQSGDITWQTRPNGSGGAVLVFQDGGVKVGEADPQPFISVPDDRGRWMQIAVHVKSASSGMANDGVIQLYRRWEGESNWTTIHEKLNAATWRDYTGPQGISHGYLMGWANDPYFVDTEWLIDSFTISSTSLLGGAPQSVPQKVQDFKIN